MANISSTFVQRALTLRHMRLLVALEELRQVGRVAAALSISQPAVSKALAEIENGVGVALFERTSRGMVPTAHGACLLRYAHMMTNEIARAVDELTGLEQGIAATVAVGATAGSGTGYLLNAAILQGCQRLPELTVSVSEGAREHSDVEAVRTSVDALAAQVHDLQSHPPAAVVPGLPRPGMNMNKRSQALRMHRRGETSGQIASALELPRQEVELLLKVHRIVLSTV